jgi:purine-binding chemotaxis protein CheW
LDALHARASTKPSTLAQADQYLTFQLDGQDYGIEILRVQEIKRWEKPTRLPHSPDHVQGVINLRGAVVPILDLRRRFGLGESGYAAGAIVIVVGIDNELGGLTAGVVVDAVCEVCSIDPADLRPAPELGSAFDGAFVRGLVVIEERMLILLDVAQLVNTMLGESATTPKVA